MDNQQKPTKKSSYTTWVIIIVVIIIALGVGSYFLFFQEEGTNTNNANTAVNTNTTTNTNAVSNANTTTNTNTVANTNTEIDTSDWLTYTNSEYGYTMKYPSDWTVEEKSLTEDPYNANRSAPFRAVHFYSPHKKLFLMVYLKKIGDIGSSLLGGGIGISDSIDGGTIEIASTNVTVTRGKLDSRTTVLLFPRGSFTTDLDGYEFGAQAGSGPGMTYEENEQFDLEGSINEQIIYFILESLTLP